MNKKTFFVSVYLKTRINFEPFGFTNYVFCFTEAEDVKEAGENAKEYFTQKLSVEVEETRPQLIESLYCDPSEIIKPFSTPNSQQQISQTLNAKEVEQTAFHSIFVNPIKRENFVISFWKRSTLYFHRLLGKWQSFTRAGIE